MTSNQSIRSEIDYLSVGAHMCAEVKAGNDGIKQIAPYMASMLYTENCIEKLTGLVECLESEFPELISYGRARATKAYETTSGSVTKPSYSGRIAGQDGHDIDQRVALEQIFAKEPYSGGLSFSVFLPNDLIDRQRPGYVPCLLSGTYLVEGGELELNVLFRSQSIIEFGIFDLIYLRKMQIEMMNRFNHIRKHNFPSLTPGNLNVLASRIFIHRRIMKIGNRRFIKRGDILTNWLRVIEDYSLSINSII